MTDNIHKSVNEMQAIALSLLEAAEIKDVETLKNKFFAQGFNEKPKHPVFPVLHDYINQFGFNEYVNLLDQFVVLQKDKLKTTFLNLILEPRYLSEQTKGIIENRRHALRLYNEERAAFNIQLVFEPENPFDPDALSVYAEGKKERSLIGYISKSFNLRIGALLKKEPFPFIQTNYEDILNGVYSSDNVIIDVYF